MTDRCHQLCCFCAISVLVRVVVLATAWSASHGTREEHEIHINVARVMLEAIDIICYKL